MDRNPDSSAPEGPLPANPTPLPRPIPVYAAQIPAPKKRPVASFFGGLLKSLLGLIFILSLILNAYLLLIISVGMRQVEYRPGQGKEKIALLDLAGTITMRTAEDIRTMLRQAEDDGNVRGVIIVVNSPGGMVAPSNMIKKYIDDFQVRTQKPVYASIQQLGASGAYWAVAGVDKIYAQQNSLVGSIGVIYMNFVLEDTLAKIGIAPVVVKSSRSPHKDRNSLFRLPDEQEIKEIQEDIDAIHQRFVTVVSSAREELTSDQVWRLADGDVFDGPESLNNKLIDAQGFLEDVIKDLARTVNLDNPPVIRYTSPPTLMDILTARANRDNPLDLQKQLEKFATTDRIQALYLGR